MFKKAKEGSILTIVSEFPFLVRDEAKIQSMMSDVVKNGGYVVSPPTKVTVEGDDADNKVTIKSEARQAAYVKLESSYPDDGLDRSIAIGGSIIFVATTEELPEAQAASRGLDHKPSAFEHATVSRMTQTVFTANGEPFDPGEYQRFKEFLIDSSLQIAGTLSSPFVRITVNGETTTYFNDAFDK